VQAKLPVNRAMPEPTAGSDLVTSVSATIRPEAELRPAMRLNERVALLPRTDNYWFSRIRSVADSLINSDFADFTVLAVYTG
jgi:hypothetical protein